MDDDNGPVENYGDNDFIDINEINKQIEGWKYYSRPPIQNELQAQLNVMQIEIDYYLEKNPVSQSDEAVIRLYGLDEHGHSFLLHIKNFEPYFYIEAPANLSFTKQNLEMFKEAFNMSIQSKQIKDPKPITKIEHVKKESVRFYKGEKEHLSNFLKITVTQPNYVASIRNLVERGLKVKEIQIPFNTYESNMPYVLRFMIDKDIIGMGWVSISKYIIRPANKMHSRSQVEIDVDSSNVCSAKIDIIAPLRILSFDIECAAEKGFPQDEKDPIIQIACVVKSHVEKENIVKVVFTLNECAPISGAVVNCSDSERKLLEEFEKFVQAVDPDILTGYNIIIFDLPYILGRAKCLKMDKFGFLGRILRTQSKIKEGKFLSKAMGMRDTKEINIEGRVQLDMLMHMHREIKLSSYTLNNVSFHFLKEQKEDVHHSIIYQLQFGTSTRQANSETRKRIAVYCIKDAELPIKLMEKLMCIYNYAEMARVTGVPINYLFTRGQQIKVASQMYRLALKQHYIIPTERVARGGDFDKYEGAFVLEPKVAFYQVPIATLDFASLYPSIMMAHNLCYTTLVKRDYAVKLNPDLITKTPNGDYFVKAEVRKGLLPQILEDLIAARKRARAQLAETQDPMLKAVLDGRQLALKISANSVYGFTGAQVGQLPCLEISASVTSFGRQMIMLAKEEVLLRYRKENGYQYDADIIYGDTDSLMVKFGNSDVAEAMALGKEAADMISSKFLKPIKLEFEKVYYPYLLLNRKRYAGLYWSKPEKWDKIDQKGIETVRRDNSGLIRMMLTQILNYILVERNIEKAIEYTKTTISQLLQNQTDISLLVITKALSKKSAEEEPANTQKPQSQASKNDAKNTYKAKQAHVELAHKMQQRDESNAPSIGDRIPYVIIEGGKGSKNYENAEDPIEVLQKDIPINYDYYIEKQLKGPLMRIFELIIPNPESLFSGEHTNIRYIPKVSQNAALGKFIVKKKTCLGCKATLDDPTKAVCKECDPKTMEIFYQKNQELNQVEKEFADLWTQCQRCQGSLHEDVLCSNRDCGIFYKRTKMQKDIKEQFTNMQRFYN